MFNGYLTDTRSLPDQLDQNIPRNCVVKTNGERFKLKVALCGPMVGRVLSKNPGLELVAV